MFFAIRLDRLLTLSSAEEVIPDNCRLMVVSVSPIQAILWPGAGEIGLCSADVSGSVTDSSTACTRCRKAFLPVSAGTHQVKLPEFGLFFASVSRAARARVTS